MSRPVHDEASHAGAAPLYDYNAHNMPKQGDDPNDEQVISVRITSSINIERGKGKLSKVIHETTDTNSPTAPVTEITSSTTVTERNVETSETNYNDDPPELAGANIEFIKQLHSKKEVRGLHNIEKIHTFPSNVRSEYYNDTEDTIAESSIKSVVEINTDNDNDEENIDNVPRGRSVAQSPSSNNYFQGLAHKPPSERGNNPRLTTVSFNIVHDTPKVTSNYNEPSDTYVQPTQSAPDPPKYYNEPTKFYNELPKVYSQPAQVYSEPAKFYSEPAKIYSEPAKIYSEPAKIYSEPAKIYSEPAKFYSQPASLHLAPNVPDYTPWQQPVVSSTISTTPLTTITNPSVRPSTKRVDHQPEKNYEVDEKLSVLTDGRSHGVQETTTESCKQENCKVGYVVEGRQYRKYRVEERTSDGFIVGEYGVVRNEDGALRGVRYTADGDASPRLIYDALMKFLQL